MSSPPLSRFDLRKKISPKQASRRSRSRSRTPSYSPPPPPSHPSRMKSKSRKKVEKAITRHSTVSTHKAVSEMRRPRSRSKSRTKRAKSGSRDRRERKTKKKRRSSSDSSSTEENLQNQRRKIKKLLRDYEDVDKKMMKSASKVLESTRSRSKRKSGSGESRRSREEEADRLHQQSVINKSKPLRVITDPDPDQVVPNAQQISPPAPPLISPSVARTTFKPKQINKDLVLVKGHKQCRVCSSYFEDTEENARRHMSHHPDRVFLVSLPSDIYFYTIEEAIIHLITKVGIKKEDIEEKVRKNILIKNPTNLRGYSCDICEALDTSNEVELNRHIRDECGVTEKTERAKHVIYFCRGCQGKFYSREELDEHASIGGCFPNPQIITKLYNDAANALIDEANKPSPTMLEIKKERVEMQEQIKIKQEKFDQLIGKGPPALVLPPTPIVPMVNPLQNFLSPPNLLVPNLGSSFHFVDTPESHDEPFNAYSNPVEEFTFNPSVPPPMLQQPPPEDISKFALHNILRNAPPPQTSSPMTPFEDQFQMPHNAGAFFPTPSTSAYPTSVRPGDHAFTLDPRRASAERLNPPLRRPDIVPQISSQEAARSRHSSNSARNHDRVSSWVSQQSSRSVPAEEEPSPVFSPLGRSRENSAKNVPTPTTPLPSVGDLFTSNSGGRNKGRRSKSRNSGRSDDEITVVGEETNTRVSSANCARLQCLWTDQHVDSCRRRQAQIKCGEGKCSAFKDLHAIWLNDPRKKMTFDDQRCKKLSFYCNGMKNGENQYHWHTPETLSEIKIIPATVTNGSYPDRSCEESSRVTMRLLSRRKNDNLTDPRGQRREYPAMTETGEAAKKFRAPAKMKGWTKEDVVIFTWSAQALVKPSKASNPHVEDEDNSDIEIL